MLIGEHQHTLDAKKRLSLPSKFRKELGKTIVVTRGLDRCLFVYSLSEWKHFTDKIATLPVGSSDTRAFSRFVMASAVEVSIDKSGRILIPDYLCDFAKLKQKVIVAGMHNRVELWNESGWRKYSSANEDRADALAEKLGEIGMI